MTSPTSVPLHLLALEQAAQPGTFTDLAVGGDSAARVTSDAQLRAAIVNVAGYYLRLAKTRTPAQMEALIWDNTSSDGADHGESCAAFASLTLELAAQAVGQQSWVTGGETYPWPLPEWADVRVDTNPDSPQITSLVADAQAHGRWHPLGDGVPAAAGRLGRVRRPRRGRDQLRRRGARHDRRRLAARPHRQRALLRRAARRAGRRGLRRQRQPQAGRRRRRVNGAGGAAAATGKTATGKTATGRSGTGKSARRRTPTPSGATAEVPGIPAANPSAGPAAAAGSGSTGGPAPAPEKAAAPKIAAGSGTAAGAAVPGVLASGDLLGGTGTGHAGPAAAGGSDATVPGLPTSSAGAGSAGHPRGDAGRNRQAPPPGRTRPPRRRRRRPPPARSRRRQRVRAHPARQPLERACQPGGTALQHPGHQGPAGVHQPGRAGSDRRAAALRRARGGDDRAGDRGVRVGRRAAWRRSTTTCSASRERARRAASACPPPSTRAGSG